jgi:hypothetical protein
MEPAFNPYQSPGAAVEDRSVEWEARPTRPDYKLYSVGSIVLATFLGNPVAGGIVMAINYRRLGRSTAALHSILWTTVFTAAIVAVATLLPDDSNIPMLAYAVPQLIAMFYLAKSLQGDRIALHQERGGAMASAWGAAGIGLLIAAITVAIILGIVCLELLGGA